MTFLLLLQFCLKLCDFLLFFGFSGSKALKFSLKPVAVGTFTFLKQKAKNVRLTGQRGACKRLATQ